jgi:hypothetical protein
MTLLANIARRYLSAGFVSPEDVKELARRALPKATDRVNAAWEALIEHPGDEVLRTRHLEAAQVHAALKELARP